MRVNIYAEEMTDRVELVTKQNDEGEFYGIRFYLYMPVSLGNGGQTQGLFIHRENDDDSSAVTFWGKTKLRAMLLKALEKLDELYGGDTHGTYVLSTADETQTNITLISALLRSIAQTPYTNAEREAIEKLLAHLRRNETR